MHRPIPIFHGFFAERTVWTPALGRRRAHLLASLQRFILILLLASLMLVLIIDPLKNQKQNIYIVLILGLAVLMVPAYILNRKGRYLPSSMITVACSVIGPWGSLLLDPTILKGDLIPLTWVVFSVLLSSILLPSAFTIFLALLQSTGLAIALALSSATAATNWPSLLAFVIASSALGILSGSISRHDVAQIDSQSEMLKKSEIQLRELSIRDYLTNLFNRRHMEETLERELDRAARKRQSLGLVMLDIDHFKAFNDIQGHAAGDAVLKAIATMLQEQIRPYDAACRFGGEEFVLIMPDSSAETTAVRAEHLRAGISRLHIVYMDRDIGAVTVSIGVAIYPDHGSTGDAVLKSADTALYRAKEEGRNRVAVAVA
jgi:diguanylate cyclase (GGDEF)-like protein